MSDPHAHHHPAAHHEHDARGAHDKHAGHSIAMFRDRFWLSLLLTLPTLAWGHMLQDALGFAAPGYNIVAINAQLLRRVRL